MIKKISSWLILSAAAVAAAVALKDGVYTGQSHSYKGPLRVAVEVKEGRISNVEVTSCQDKFARKVVKEMPRRIMKAGSVDVDVVSGATVSSRAIKKAVAQALEAAR